MGLLLGVAWTTEAAPPSNVAYRRIDLQDAATGEMFPVALWYPTRAAPVPLLLTGSLSACRLPVMLCRLIAFEMQVASNAAPADGKFGLIVISHGAGGLSLNHRDLAMALASHGYVVAAPTHPRGKDNDISGPGVWVGRPKQVSRVIDAVLEDTQLGSRIQPERIGVVGHSNGGYTALAVAGAKPSTGAASPTVGSIPTTPDAPSEMPPLGTPLGRLAIFRTSVILACAPSCSWRRMRPRSPTTRSQESPFRSRVYGAERDDLTLVRHHAERVAKALPPGTEYILVKRAGHFSFVTSFPWALKIVAGEAAQDVEGFDRDAMHEVMNAEIVGFFDRKLALPD